MPLRKRSPSLYLFGPCTRLLLDFTAYPHLFLGGWFPFSLQALKLDAYSLFPNSMVPLSVADISADITELGQSPVAVVCAGAKSILDLGLTLECLETRVS